MSRLFNTTKGWFAVGIVGALLLLLLGWLLLISPQRSQVASINEEIATTEQQTQSLIAKANALRKQADELAQMQASLAALSSKLPDQAGVDSLIRQIDAANQASGLQIQSFSVSPAQPLEIPGAAEAAAAAPAAAAPAEGESPDTAAAASEAASAGAAAAALATSLEYIPVTIEFTKGSYSTYLNYLNQIENLSRALLVTSVTLSGEGAELAMSIQAQIFVRPGAGGTSSASPAATPTASASPSPAAS